MIYAENGNPEWVVTSPTGGGNYQQSPPHPRHSR